MIFDIWREACRHIEIADSCERFREILAGGLPLDRLMIFRLDTNDGTLERLATSPAAASGLLPPGLQQLPPDAIDRLNAWTADGRVRRWSADRTGSDHHPPDAARILLGPPASTGSWLAAPLQDPAGHQGFMAMQAATPPGAYNALHEQLVAALRDPLSAALQNDLRLRETIALRNTAEAEKRAALRRLGRDSLQAEIVGAKFGLRSVMQRVELVAHADVPVLIFGETGTGKEVIARAIHEHSPRASGPFVRVNSGAIPVDLIDSELFGHEKGAFTGADSRRAGWFERADGGTLLLDEIGELSLPAQVRLLRALQEGEIQRVGGSVLHVNVRVVAATHRDLAAMVQAGRFREDLWYRLNVFPLVIPPLRERPADLPALATHFCERAAHRFGFRIHHPTPEQLAALAAYHWPGNVRELASVMDRAVILGEGAGLEIERALGSTGAPGRTPDANRGTTSTPTTPRGREALPTLNEALRVHIEQALHITHGRVEGPHGAARLLHINPHTLRAKMRKMGIHWQQFRLPVTK